jgi:hypothetical protein
MIFMPVTEKNIPTQYIKINSFCCLGLLTTVMMTQPFMLEGTNGHCIITHILV